MTDRSLDTRAPITRWLAGTILIGYGFAKINGMQFLVVESELDRTLRDVSGFWLAWHYFGYSTPYRLLIAAVEIGGGLLLLLPRTALLGALILVPVMANVVLTDIFFGIGALPMSLLLVLLLARIIWPRLNDLREVVVGARSAEGALGWRRAVAVALVVISAIAFNGMIRGGTQLDTPVTGVWEIERVGGDQRHPWVGERLYLERNRAHMAVLPQELAHGEYPQHYEVDGLGRVQILEQWLDPNSPVIMEGEVDESGRLRLEGTEHSANTGITLRRILPGS